MELREDKGLITRMLLAVRCRLDLDTREVFSENELSVVPKALFRSPGDLRRTAKSTLLNTLASLSATCPSRQRRGIARVDVMAEVQRFHLPSNAITGNDFAHYFIRHIKMEFVGYNLVLLVFDRYDKESMKNPTRSKRYEEKTSCAIRILDKTDISKTTKQKILASTATKSSLTEYLAHKILSQSWKQTMIVSWNETILFTSPTDTWEASVREEADTKIIFHALQLPKDTILDIHLLTLTFWYLYISFMLFLLLQDLCVDWNLAKNPS